MSSDIPVTLNAQSFRIPDPPEELGLDGGKFHRAYDALADEIDEDMTKSLKEQLDGMLIFAGLFAGINSTFLSFTLPLLSPNLCDDTNALLAQNNAILWQLATGVNSTILINSALPSSTFSPSRDIFAVNILFASSLAFAIISSFLAVLGRQWLVYYRKRSGGGPDRQRWEQMKRFLGAQRWRLELILDDVLPSLLQSGLIIFCVALIIYLRVLSPPISTLIEIPVYLGLSIFIGSALCTLWDAFCPFQSPLSHLLSWGVHSIPSMSKSVGAAIVSSFSSLLSSISRLFTIAELERQIQTIRRSSPISDTTDASSRCSDTPTGARLESLKKLMRAVSPRRWLQFLTKGREEESLESLQIVAIQRAICASDDLVTLLCATGNILGISSATQMEELWSDPLFQERFFDQFRHSYTRVSQLRGRNQVNMAAAARRLYCAAAAHSMLIRDVNWWSFQDLVLLVYGLHETEILIPGDELSDSPTCLLRSTLVFQIFQFYTYPPPDDTIKKFCNSLALYSRHLEREDWRLFCVVSWIVSNLRILKGIANCSMGSLRNAYRGNVDDVIRTLKKAFEVLVGPECRDFADCDTILINMLRCLNRIVAVDREQSPISTEHKFSLVACYEPVLRSLRLPEGARRLVRKLQLNLAHAWEQEYIVWGAARDIPASVPSMLVQHLTLFRTIYQANSSFAHHEYIDLLRVFHPPVHRLFSHGPELWLHTLQASGERTALRNIFNDFTLDLDNVSRRIQNKAHKVRDPDGRWCHWQEEWPLMRAAYFFVPDPPESEWYQYEVFLHALSRCSAMTDEGTLSLLLYIYSFPLSVVQSYIVFTEVPLKVRVD
ncbi:hypothetical protein M407DRAFT_25023 [Tulasnella calospora MUT 4182]|uniref:DUF6535 domain-containing protein n=1 Tax=Tulasnella calospora MUT 4182 TaxID=1051891 RepID=A0A0C3QIA1_9AGAM|nr:hypothetical protein M407DRAFT_25023 [Tulasnella calospora MUT 4182]